MLLTLIGVAAITTSRLESEISGNEKAYQQAFYAAELGLVVGERTIETLPTRAALQESTAPGHSAQSSLRYDRTTSQVIKTGEQGTEQPLQWDQTDSIVVADVPNGLSGVATPPRYIIEERNFQRDTLGQGMTYGVTGSVYFTVIARGTGGNPAAHTLLETVYAKRF